jgi:hypothetical protein
MVNLSFGIVKPFSPFEGKKLAEKLCMALNICEEFVVFTVIPTKNSASSIRFNLKEHLKKLMFLYDAARAVRILLMVTGLSSRFC